MTETSQIKPLTPYGIRSDEEGGDLSSTYQTKKLNRQKHAVKCVGCCMAGILVLAVLIIILMLTVFHVSAPKIKMNRFIIPPLSINNIPSTINILVDVSVKNPNVASFKYKNSTTTLYYYGKTVGEAHTPAGTAKARRTQNMNLSMEVTTAQILADPNFGDEIGAGILTVDSYTRLDGRVKIIEIIKKDVVVKMNCTLKANITSQEILEQNCKRKVSI